MFQPMNFIEFLTLPPEHPLWQREQEMIEKHVVITTLDMSDPDALEKWKYPPVRAVPLKVGERALQLVEVLAPKKAA